MAHTIDYIMSHTKTIPVFVKFQIYIIFILHFLWVIAIVSLDDAPNLVIIFFDIIS